MIKKVSRKVLTLSRISPFMDLGKDAFEWIHSSLYNLVTALLIGCVVVELLITKNNFVTKKETKYYAKKQSILKLLKSDEFSTNGRKLVLVHIFRKFIFYWHVLHWKKIYYHFNLKYALKFLWLISPIQWGSRSLKVH